MIGPLCGATRVFGFKPTHEQEVKILAFPPLTWELAKACVGVGSALVFVGNLMFPLWFAVLLRWFIFCLFRSGSFHLVPCIPPFFGSFGLFMIGRVSLKKKREE